MVNPRVTWFRTRRNIYEEGCLSIPDQYADVERPAEVEVDWLDRDGRLQKESFGGLWATCVQHEIDHLDGRLFIDYLKPLRRQMITRKMVKLKQRTRAGTRMSLLPDPALARPAALDALRPGRRLRRSRRWSRDMFETMYTAPGRGLAAPQVGVMLRLFVMDTGWKHGDTTPMVCIDPEITERSEAMATGGEGCLSIPGVTGDGHAPCRNHARLHRARRRAPDRAASTGSDAICAQHECDHLDGLVHLRPARPAARARPSRPNTRRCRDGAALHRLSRQAAAHDRGAGRRNHRRDPPPLGRT